jgi:hypothetical protein
MSRVKTFTLSEAQALVPELRQSIERANVELEKIAGAIEVASRRYETVEKVLASSNTDSTVEALSQLQNRYLDRFNFWVDRITATGVVLRDLRTGLLDFPARQGQYQYFLCWRLDDDDELLYWHPIKEGFAGRRPLAVLSEYAV